MITNVTNILTMLADVYLMMTNVYPMVAKESSVANPQKVAKIDEKIRKIEHIIWQRCFRLKTADELLDSSASIGHIGYHRFYQLPSAIHRLAIGRHCWHRWGIQCIFGHQQQSQHRRPDVIGT